MEEQWKEPKQLVAEQRAKHQEAEWKQKMAEWNAEKKYNKEHKVRAKKPEVKKKKSKLLIRTRKGIVRVLHKKLPKIKIPLKRLFKGKRMRVRLRRVD